MSKKTEHNEDKIREVMFSYADAEFKNQNLVKYVDHYLEQYRIYLLNFTQLSDRRLKTNEFFLGINTAIMAVIGYIETREVAYAPVIFIFVPFVGVAICFSWYQIMNSFAKLTKAKFKVLHMVEEKLPISLFQSEWMMLGEGKDKKRYLPLSYIEKRIPLIFILLYLLIFFVNSPMMDLIRGYLPW